MHGNARHRPSGPERTGRGGGARGDGRPVHGQGRSGPGPGKDRRQAGPQTRAVTTRAVDHEHLTRLIGPVVGAAGMDLETVRAAAAGRRLLVRVVVDADGGVALDDIAELSRALSDVLDSDRELGETPYTLEVTSPGVDRPLTEPRHWRRAVGRLVRVQAGDAAGAARAGAGNGGHPGPPEAVGQRQAGAQHGAQTLQARVVKATEDGVTLDIDGSQRTFGYADLGPGRVQVEFGHFAEESDVPDGGEPDGH